MSVDFIKYGFKEFEGPFSFKGRTICEFEGMMPKSVIEMRFTVAYQELLYAKKIDGERCLIYYDVDKIYVKFRHGKQFVRDNSLKTCVALILDCEVTDVVTVIDCPHFGSDMGNFKVRYGIMRGLALKLRELPYKCQDFFGMMNFPRTCDGEGYIFMRMEGRYSVTDATSYKWKVVPTVDVEVKDSKVNIGGLSATVCLDDGCYEFDVEGRLVKNRPHKKQNSDFVINAVLNEDFSIYHYLMADMKLVVTNKIALFVEKLAKRFAVIEEVVSESEEDEDYDVEITKDEEVAEKVNEKIEKDVILQINNHKPTFINPKMFVTNGRVTYGPRKCLGAKFESCYVNGRRVKPVASPIRAGDKVQFKSRNGNAVKDLIYKKKKIRKNRRQKKIKLLNKKKKWM